MPLELFIKIRTWFVILIMLLICPIGEILVLVFEIPRKIYKNCKLKNIDGEIALVTGAAHGLGRCIAIELAKKGCHVAVADINLRGADDTVEFIKRNYHVKAKAYKVDVSNFEEVSALNAQLTQDMGAVSILVNNAGIIFLSNYDQPDWKEVQNMFNVNVLAQFWTNQIFLENMKMKKKGHIVAISSLSGMVPLSWYSHYTSTKYAVRGMMRALRMELKANSCIHGNIYATTVFPSFLKTNDKMENIVKKSGIDFLYPTMSGVKVAKRVVLGIRRNELEIILPELFTYMYKILEFAPAYIQDMVLNKIFSTKLQKKNQANNC